MKFKPGLRCASYLLAVLLPAACVLTPDPYYDNYGPTVYSAPPAPIVEYQGYAPTPGYIWIAGYWDWIGSRYEWRRGHWAPPRQGQIWMEPRWERHGDAWRRSGGQWVPEGHRPPPGVPGYRPAPGPNNTPFGNVPRNVQPTQRGDVGDNPPPGPSMFQNAPQQEPRRPDAYQQRPMPPQGGMPPGRQMQPQEQGAQPPRPMPQRQFEQQAPRPQPQQRENNSWRRGPDNDRDRQH